MNGFEQRIRQTAIAQAEAQLKQLTEGLEALGTIVQAIDERHVALGQGLADAFDANAARVTALAATVDRLQTALGQNGLAVLTFFEMTWWQRLRWIVVGRWVVPPAAVVGDR